MVPENFNTLAFYLNERESIRLRRMRGEPGPWTADPILRNYKFTNVKRINDRTTQWLLSNWYNPNRDADPKILALNCAIARYFGSIEFMEDIGFQHTWNPEFLIQTAQDRLAAGKKVFTGAYIITNAGSTAPKQIVVVTQFLTPFRTNVDRVTDIARTTNRWQPVCEFIQTLPGIGPFMSKEIALDMMLTPVLENATDKLTWTPAGPGAIRGLNRLFGRPTQAGMSQQKAVAEMKDVLGALTASGAIMPDFPRLGVEFGVTDLQFCLCEFDKYLRVKNNEGRPRSGYDFRKAKPLVF